MTALGWAFWGQADIPQHWLLELGDLGEGEAYAHVRGRLTQSLQPGDHVGIEGAIMPEGMSLKSRLALYGVRAVILLAAHECRCRVEEYPPQTWRSRYLGVTGAPRSVLKKHRRNWIKQRAISEAASRGWGTVGPDVADALGILHCTRVDFDATYARRGTLFQG